MSAVISSRNASLSGFGKARSTVQGAPLSADELWRMHAFWRGCDYLALGMIYLQGNALEQGACAPVKEKFRNQQIECRNCACEHGIDKPEIAEWRPA